MKKLYLSGTNRKIGGVCAGLGEYFDVDPTLIRVLFVLLLLFTFGFAIFAYILIWIIIPKRPKEEKTV
jgi:phage shock protein PspC (stress-responsive transcriptional regulator)